MIKKLKITIIIILGLNIAYCQTQIGQDIIGESSFDTCGASVSMSSDGTILAVGSPYNSDNGNRSGKVKIYKSINDNWVQIGNSIIGLLEHEGIGSSVSLSSNGNILAIGNSGGDSGPFNGYVRVFENINDDWVQIGGNLILEPIGPFYFSGTSVSLSSDGSTLAVGVPRKDLSEKGYARLYTRNTSNQWIQIGNDIVNNNSGSSEEFGAIIKLSSNGNIIAISAPNYNSGFSGFVRIYENISDNWVQVGNTIEGDPSNDFFGKNISLSSNGDIIAIGAPQFSGTLKGYIKVYQNQGSSWIQIGQDVTIPDSSTREGFGSNLSLSSNGDRLVGSTRGGGGSKGETFIFKYESDSWIQIGTIEGGATGQLDGQMFTTTLNLVANGTILAIGSPELNVNDNPLSGLVQVYNISSLLSTDKFLFDIVTVFPNPTSSFINIQLNNVIKFKKVSIYNNIGQLISEENKPKINVSKYPKGIYFLEIHTEKGKTLKKIIIK